MAQFPHGVEPVSRLPMARAALLVVVSSGFAAAFADAGCAPRDGSFMPGISNAPAGGSPSSSVSAQPPHWERFDSVAKLHLLLADFTSRGHGTGSWKAQLRGSPGAGEALDSLVQGEHFPVGTLLVQQLKHGHSGVELGFFVMEKRDAEYFVEGGDWEYLVVRRDGRIEARGKLETCARCHAEAPIDFVFPRLREAPATKDD